MTDDSDIPDWSQEPVWDSELQPMLKFFLNRCEELGIPVLVYASLGKNEKGVAMIRANNASDKTEPHAPLIMKTIKGMYDTIAENGIQVQGIAFVSEEEMKNATIPVTPRPPGNKEYLN